MTNPVKCKLRLFIIKLRNDSFSSELHNALSSVHPYKATKVDPCRLGRQRYKTLRFSPAFQLSTERGAGITKGKRAIRRHFVKCACASLFVPPCAFLRFAPVFVFILISAGMAELSEKCF